VTGPAFPEIAVTAKGEVLRLDATACAGIGMCAFVAPSLVGVDDWGYPVVERGALTSGDLRRARAAAAACPRRALFLAPAR
jgi:ferredoxin